MSLRLRRAMGLALTGVVLTSCAGATSRLVDVASVSPGRLSGVNHLAATDKIVLDVTGRGPRAERPIATATGNALIWLNCPGTGHATVSVGDYSTTVACRLDDDGRYWVVFADIPRTPLPVTVLIDAKTPWRLQVVQTNQ